MARATSPPAAPSAPARPWAATVNISLGSLAGPHDGTSMAEQALADLSADARVAVVVAAGNLPPHSRVHGQRLVQPGQPGRFTVRLPPGIQRDSFVEFWLPNHGVDTALLAVQVLAPPALGLAPLRLAVGECAALGPAAKVQAGVVWARAVAQGLNGSLLLLAIAPTSPGPDPDRAQARPGFWTVEISTQGQQALEVHGWVERDDVLIGSRRAQQIRFEPDRQAGATAGYINNRHTLTHLAHGAGVTVAGGYVVSTQRAASGSARGPLRGARQASQPAWYAPIAQSPSLPGIAVVGFFSGRRSRIGGTSAAAPQVARALVEAAMAAERTPAKAGRSAKPADQAAKPAYPTCKPATGRPRLWPPADDPDSDAIPPNAQVL